MGRASLVACGMLFVLAACGGGSGGDGAATPAPPPPAPPPVAAPPVNPGITLFAGQLPREGSTDGPAAEARFSGPGDVAQGPDGSLYIADTGNATVRRLGPDGQVTTVAGTPGQVGFADGRGAAVRFGKVAGLAVDGAGNVYIADPDNHVVRRLSPSGEVATVLGRPGEQGGGEGPAGSTRLNSPNRVAVDAAGHLFVLDNGNGRIVHLAPDGTSRTLAQGIPFGLGLGLALGPDGSVYVSHRSGLLEGWVARFDRQGEALPWSATGELLAAVSLPWDIAVDAGGRVHVATGANYSNSRFELATNGLVVLAPSGAVERTVSAWPKFGADDGPQETAQFANPTGVALGRDGELLVADTGNHVVRRWRAGTVDTIAGSAERGRRDGVGTQARFEQPTAIRRAPDGSLYVLDSGLPGIRRLALDGTVTTIVPRTAGGVTLPAGEFLADLAVGPDGLLYLLARTGINTAVLYRVRPTGEATLLLQGSDMEPPLVMDGAGNLYAGTSGGLTRSLGPDRAGTVLQFGPNPGRQGTFLAARGAALFGSSGPQVERLVPGNVSEMLAGHLFETGNRDGRGADARFERPTAMSLDDAGNVYLLDSVLVILDSRSQPLSLLRRVSPAGDVRTLAGNRARVTPEPGPLAGSLGVATCLAWSAGAVYVISGRAVLKVVPAD